METIGDRIKRLRNAADLTQDQLAKDLSVSRVAVTKWESGQTANLKLANLLSLCRLFHITADDMLKGELPNSPRNNVLTAQDSATTNQNEYARIARKRAFPDDLEAAYMTLTDAGQDLVRTQLQISIETARRMHGTRPDSSQTAA